ncbi:type IV pilus modification PilV family protein [Psychromonas sp. PT13]|uniref:type IV pilus modification PilV family protein n=1 Tax=Psychromonas sp. PT13 TaxID=3439547 RepID=UPI003EBBA575
MQYYKTKQSGMTLIEVLIASVILFVAIGTTAGVHRVLNHYQRLNQVDYALLLNQQSFFDYLFYELEQGNYSGDYKLGEYSLIWEAQLNKRKQVVETWDPELSGSIDSGYSYSNYVALYDVEYHVQNYPGKTFEITQLVVEPKS